MADKVLSERTERKKVAILRVLMEAGEALSSIQIAERLRSEGMEISQRTVRLYLQYLDSQGFTEKVGKTGRKITQKGKQELEISHVFEKVGFLEAKIDQMAYQMTFSLEKRTGTVVANITLLSQKDLQEALPFIVQVFRKGFAMGNLIGFFGPGEEVCGTVVPEDHFAFATVCSVTINGVLLKHGIPTHSRFGGLLEVVEGKPHRFVEIIAYNGTSIDPLEIFIRSGMTDYRGAVMTGTGRIGVGFREFPAESREHVAVMARSLERVGLGGFMALGWPGQPLLGIPVGEGRFGAIVIGGMNPAAILEELGLSARSKALAGLIEYEILIPYHDLERKARERGFLKS